MVDRMPEVLEALQQGVVGGVGIGVNMDDPAPVSGFWSDLVGQYSWTAESKSTTGLVSPTQLSIALVAERTAELASAVRDMRGQRRRRATIAPPMDIKDCMAEASWLHSQALDRLKQIAKQNKKGIGDDWGLITCRGNLHGRFVRLLQSAISEFELAVDEFREDEREDARRQLRQVGIEDEKKIDNIISQGATQQVLHQAMSGDVSDALQAVEGRHRSIMQLERDIVQLRDLFIDLEALVELQQKSVDSIESHIHKAKDYVGDGHRALEKGQADQNTNRKLMCCILLIVLLALAAITSTVILKTQP